MKQEFQIVKLFFNEPLALMSEKKDEFQNEVTSLASDMLKAAIISALALQASQEEVEKLNNDLMVSSAFLFYKEHYFFPKPLSRLPIKKTNDPGLQKKIKKIQFIEKSLFEKIISNEPVKLQKNQLIQNNKLWVDNSSLFPTNIFKSQTEERVNIGNTNVFGEAEKGSPFYISRTYFVQDDHESGLYFIAQTRETELLEKSLNILKDQGIGADRRVGNGHFEFEISSLSLLLPDSPNRKMLLSKFIPQKEEIENGLLENASYQLSKRGGYAAGSMNENFNHWSKLNIMTINESAVFDNKIPLQGKMVKLSTPEMEKAMSHPIYREGRAVTIPLQTDEKTV
jgi:CRISPR type III-A-associated RAMP protein Csm4